MKNIAINGFGRIGRLVFRQLVKDDSLNVVAINDLTNIKTLAHLLKYDTAHGGFCGEVDFDKENLIVNGKKIKVYAERNPKNLPWAMHKIDVVVEATGFFRTMEAAQAHIDAGAKKVAISAPGGGDMKTVVFRVNEGILNSSDTIISAASCTTNCLAPVADVLDKKFGIVKGFMTTVHAFTNDQKLQDAPHPDLRRARAGAHNIIPTTTGAAVAVGKVLPQLKGRLDGIAFRVPVITGSVVDLVVELKKAPTVDEINMAMKAAANDSFKYLVDPIVSSDVIDSTYGSLFDSLMTSAIEVDGKKLYKLVSWYDNESSYVSQYVRTLKYFVNL